MTDTQTIQTKNELSSDELGKYSIETLDRLWKVILVDRHESYGDWEYPGQVYYHVLYEFLDMERQRNALVKELTIILDDYTDVKGIDRVNNLLAACQINKEEE